FCHAPCAHTSYTLSLHDALPILASRERREKLQRSRELLQAAKAEPRRERQAWPERMAEVSGRDVRQCDQCQRGQMVRISEWEWGDRKSTRLNSSHQIISYAVFCF